MENTESLFIFTHDTTAIGCKQSPLSLSLSLILPTIFGGKPPRWKFKERAHTSHHFPHIWTATTHNSLSYVALYLSS